MKTVIGLEIHVQLKTKSKMFCGCDNNAEGKEPNSVVCPICMGMPGTLPVANKQAIDWTLKTGLALHAEVAKKSKFDRKHYFYPDLPKGYQISQYDQPFCKGGYLEVDVNGEKKKIQLRRIHLEEDAGKLIHPAGANYSLVDLNRAGTPLMEVVTEPDINSPAEAKLFLQKLRTILRHLDVSDADMEKGHLRCDANISISQLANGSWEEGMPVEIKNMNSFKAAERALRYEEKRQKEIIKEGGKIEKETRAWSEAKQMTILMRGKEFAHDYRYFPEPDLPPFYFDDEYVATIKRDVPEDLESEREKMKKDGIMDNLIVVIQGDPDKKEYLFRMVKFLDSREEVRLAAKWIVNRFFNEAYPVDKYAKFIQKLSNDEIPQARAMEVIKKSCEEKKSIEEVIKELGLTKIADKETVNIINEVVKENEKPVADYKAGKKVALKFLIGQVMAKSKGQIDPKIVEDILKTKLK
jgi:aspartyl-tRNA(Asn)/glutamyl-tRNA(Gln) amidotransferase subunit B